MYDKSDDTNYNKIEEMNLALIVKLKYLKM